MPHLIQHDTPAGVSALMKYLGYTPEQFALVTESMVAHEFNLVLDEDLVAGETVKTDGIFTSGTMPVDILLTVICWATPARMDRTEELGGSIQTKIVSLFRGRDLSFDDLPKIQVSVIIVGN